MRSCDECACAHHLPVLPAVSRRRLRRRDLGAVPAGARLQPAPGRADRGRAARRACWARRSRPAPWPTRSAGGGCWSRPASSPRSRSSGWVYAPGLLGVCAPRSSPASSFALVMGSDEAYLFDALAHDDAEAHFPRMLGGLWAVFQFAAAISFVAGGYIADCISRELAFGMTAVCALVASAIALRLPDDRRGHSAAHGLRIARRAVSALRMLAAAGRADHRLEPALGDRHGVVAVHAGAARAARRVGHPAGRADGRDDVRRRRVRLARRAAARPRADRDRRRPSAAACWSPASR